MVSREFHKYEKSIIVAAGISFWGVGEIILCSGNMNGFSYSKAVHFNKDDITITEKELLFEQDGAPSHTSRKNKLLLNKVIGGGKCFQNAQIH